MKHFIYPLLAIAALGLSACSSTSINNKNDFHTNPKYVMSLDDSDFMPTKAMLKRKVLKGAVVSVEIHSKLAGSTLLAPVINVKVVQLLLDAGVEVIDREAGNIVRRELEAYEKTGRSTGLAVDVANVVLAPVIASATHDVTFIPAYYSEKDNKRKYNPAQCAHKTELSGYIKIYNMPSMKQRKQITLEKNITYMMEANRSRHSRYSTKRDCDISETMLTDFIMTTAKDAIRIKANDIRNAFSPTGFVLERRRVEDKHYIKINQGTDLDLVQNLAIQFKRTIENKDNLTGEVTRDELVMGKGEVTDFIHKNSAWVEVSELLAKQILRGDKARVLFKTRTYF